MIKRSRRVCGSIVITFVNQSRQRGSYIERRRVGVLKVCSGWRQDGGSAQPVNQREKNKTNQGSRCLKGPTYSERSNKNRPLSPTHTLYLKGASLRSLGRDVIASKRMTSSKKKPSIAANRPTARLFLSRCKQNHLSSQSAATRLDNRRTKTCRRRRRAPESLCALYAVYSKPLPLLPPPHSLTHSRPTPTLERPLSLDTHQKKKKPPPVTLLLNKGSEEN